MKAIGSNLKNNKTLLFLVLSTLFCGLLLIVRLWMMGVNWDFLSDLSSIYQVNGKTSFLFLSWNLFLAWVPYGLSRLLNPTRSWILNGGIFLLWLLFFPNAPYILTDLLHLKNRWVVPHWFDLMLLITFAWTGLLVGFASLRNIQQFFASKWSGMIGGIVAYGCLILSAYGVFIGRFQRWNSWDIITQPFNLFQEAIAPLADPMDHMQTLGLAIVMSGFLVITYGTMMAFTPINTPKNQFLQPNSKN